MSDQLSGIAVFVRAAEAASFAVAAEQMGLSRSAVGKAVARLEERLSVQLFHRTTRSLRLTDEGALFYARCSRALAEINAAEQGFDDGQREPIGRVRISVPVLLGRHCIAPIVVDLAQAHSQLEIEVAFTDIPVDLREDGFDLVVRVGALANAVDMKMRRLGAQTMMLCASPSYLRIRSTPLRLEDIASHDTLAYGKGNHVVPWLFVDHGRQHAIKTAGRIHFNDLEAIADAAIAGAGLAWLPSWLIEKHLQSGRLIEVLSALRGPDSDIYALWPPRHYLPMRVRVVIDALATRMQSMLSRELSSLAAGENLPTLL